MGAVESSVDIHSFWVLLNLFNGSNEVEGNHGFTSHFDMSGFTCVLALLFDWFIASILYVINT